jgi:hypothetical protein
MNPLSLVLAALPVASALVMLAVQGGRLVGQLLAPVYAARDERRSKAIAKLRADLAPRVPPQPKPAPAPEPAPAPPPKPEAPPPAPVAQPAPRVHTQRVLAVPPPQQPPPRQRFPRGSKAGRAIDHYHDDEPTAVFARRHDIFDDPTRPISFEAPTRVVRRNQYPRKDTP